MSKTMGRNVKWLLGRAVAESLGLEVRSALKAELEADGHRDVIVTVSPEPDTPGQRQGTANPETLVRVRMDGRAPELYYVTVHRRER